MRHCDEVAVVEQPGLRHRNLFAGRFLGRSSDDANHARDVELFHDLFQRPRRENGNGPAHVVPASVSDLGQRVVLREEADRRTRPIAAPEPGVESRLVPRVGAFDRISRALERLAEHAGGLELLKPEFGAFPDPVAEPARILKTRLGMFVETPRDFLISLHRHTSME